MWAIADEGDADMVDSTTPPLFPSLCVWRAVMILANRALDRRVKRVETREQLAGVAPKLATTIAGVKELQVAVQRDLSTMFDNRVVNILGDINTI